MNEYLSCVSKALWIYIRVHNSDEGFKSKTPITALAVEEIFGLERLQSNWLSHCSIRGRELVQLAGYLRVPGSNPSWGSIIVVAYLWMNIYNVCNIQFCYIFENKITKTGAFLIIPAKNMFDCSRAVNHILF